MTREEVLRLALEATPNDPAKAIQTARDMLAFLSEEPKSAFSSPASKPPVADAAPDLLAGWTPLPHNPPDVAEPSGLTEQAKILLGLTSCRRRWISTHDEKLSFYITRGDSSALYDAAIALRRSIKACHCRAARLFSAPQDAQNLTRMYRFARDRLMEEAGQYGTL